MVGEAEGVAQHDDARPAAGDVYDPPCVRVAAGTTVTIGASGSHPLARSNRGSAANPIPVVATSPAMVQFAAPGFYPFYCDNHGSNSGAGMAGVVCGHIHRAALRAVGPVLYANTGDWVETCSALAEREDGTLTLLTFAAAAAVLWYGGRQVIEGAVSPGDLFAFVLFAGILIGPFGSAARMFAQVREAQGAMQRVLEILDTQPEVRDRPDAVDMTAIRGHVRVDRVSFAYDPRQPVLVDVSFEVRPGEMVAFVGPTGAGKSTLVNLLHRFYDPTEGSVTIDGHDLRTVRLDSLYRQIALVPQETMLFGGTILDNIRYGRQEATEEEVIAASRAANAHDFIIATPDGYRTPVGEKGVNLSGGQRQRVAIARAVLKNPSILMLDEATSALDSESEMLIQDALDRLMSGRTTFVIAHRLTTVQRADRILVLNKGRIVEEGTHASLMERKGLYQYLYTLRLEELAAGEARG